MSDRLLWYFAATAYFYHAGYECFSVFLLEFPAMEEGRLAREKGKG